MRHLEGPKNPDGGLMIALTKSRHICIRICVQSTHVYVYARRQDEILDELLFPLLYVYIFKRNVRVTEMFELHETGDWDIFRAHGKRRGFSPGAAARHSQFARANTDSRNNYFLFFKNFFFWLQHFFQIFPKSPKQPISSYPDSQHWPVRTARAVLTDPYRSRSEQASLGNLGMTKSDVLGDLWEIWEKGGSQKKIRKK